MQAIQLGAKEEEPSLRNLRRVLQLVAITLIVLGCVEMFHGKTVVSTDLHSVAVLNMEGQRLALQQVSLWGDELSSYVSKVCLCIAAQDLVYITVELLGAAAGLPDFNFADIAQNLSTTLSEIISTHNYLTYSDPPSYKPQVCVCTLAPS